ncbi:MAG: hypothetical protein AB8B77_02315, partial [Alphaproteobacteria bacterium]
MRKSAMTQKNSLGAKVDNFLNGFQNNYGKLKNIQWFISNRMVSGADLIEQPQESSKIASWPVSEQKQMQVGAFIKTLKN